MSTLISTVNAVQTAGTNVSSSSEVDGLGLQSILTEQVADVWRSGTESERVIRVTFPKVFDIGVLALAAPSDGQLCEAHARIRLTCSAVAEDGTDALDTGDVCGAMPTGRWAYPVGAAVDPNRIWNPCPEEAMDGWVAGGTTVPTLAPATGRWKPTSQGAGTMSGSGIFTPGSTMEAASTTVELASSEPVPDFLWDATIPGVPIPPGFAFTRPHTPSTAITHRTNSAGLLEAVAQGVARQEYTPAGEMIGFLQEQGTTNMLTAPRDLSNAAWTKLNTTIAPNASVCPTGTIECDRIIPTTTVGVHNISSEALTFAVGEYTLSFYVKAFGATYPWIRVGLPTNVFGSSLSTAVVNQSTGAIGLYQTAVVPKMIAVSGGIYRCVVTGYAATAGSGSVTIGLNTTNSLTATSIAGVTTAGADIWGVQVEADGYASSLVLPALGSTGPVTRGDDAYTGSLGFSTTANRITVYMDKRVTASALRQSDASEIGGVVLRRGTGTGDTLRFTAVSQTAAPSGSTWADTVRIRASAVYQPTVFSTGLPFGQNIRTVFVGTLNDSRLYTNGSLARQMNSGIEPIYNALYSVVGNGVVYIRELRVYSAILSDAQARGLSATGLTTGLDTWEFQGSVLSQQCNVTPVLRWTNAAGTIIAETQGTPSQPSSAADGKLLSKYTLVRAAAPPPVGATRVTPVFVVTASTTAIDPTVIFTRASLSRAVGMPWGRSYLVMNTNHPGMISAKYITIRIKSTRNYIQLGRVWAGPALFTQLSPTYGITDSFADTGTNDRAQLSGLRFGEPGKTYRQRSLQIEEISPDEAESLRAMFSAAGATRQVFVAPLVERASDHGILGVLTNANFTETNYDSLGLDLSIEEDC